MAAYYDGTKLLSLSDINGNKPELYLCTSNRTAGKTTYFNRLLVNRFLDKGDKFCLIYRYNYELSNVSEKFFRDIKSLFFKNNDMTSKSFARGLFQELFLDGEPCGYAITLNAADQIKKYSHFFSDVKRLLFDEFQSETNKYCDNEIAKFISVHKSIARGQGQQSRYVPVYMCSNPVSIINPYYVELGISTRLSKDTNFLRGNGFVLEQSYNESAAKASELSGFDKAFGDTKYIAYANQNVYLNDNESFIEKPIGKSHYLATLKYNGRDYAVRDFPELGIIYCDNRVDETFKGKLAVTTEDHNINYVMLKRNDFFVSSLRYYFNHGCFRFKDLNCKEAILRTISY